MKKLTFHSFIRGAAIFVAVLLWVIAAPVTAFFWNILLVWAAFDLDSRIIGIAAIVLLIFIPLALSTLLYEWVAEPLAAYVFYLLCIFAGLQTRHLGEDEVIEPVRPERLTLDLQDSSVTLQTLELVPNNDTKEKPSLTNTTSEKMWDIRVKKVSKPPVT